MVDWFVGPHSLSVPTSIPLPWSLHGQRVVPPSFHLVLATWLVWVKSIWAEVTTCPFCCKSWHEKPCISTCTLVLLPSLPSRLLLPLLPGPQNEWTHISQGFLGQPAKLQWETEPSSQAQPRSSEPDPAHVSVSNNKWLLFKYPECGVVCYAALVN